MAEYLNKNIKYLRTIKKLSQDDVANGSGIERSLLSRIENNKVETSVENVKLLSDYFNVSISDLVSKDLSFNGVTPKTELELLFDKNKDILTDHDIEMIKFIVEQRKKEIDNMK